MAALIVFLAVRLLVRHRHRHEHGHQVRNPLAAFGIGLVHGMGGSAGVGVLLLAAIPSNRARRDLARRARALHRRLDDDGDDGLRRHARVPAGRARGRGAGARHRQPRLRLLVRRRGMEPDAVSVLGDRFGGVEPVCVADFERLAEERLEPGAFGYYAGGAGDERALAGNVEAWRALTAPAARPRRRRATSPRRRRCSARRSRCRCSSRRPRSSGSRIRTASRGWRVRPPRRGRSCASRRSPRRRRPRSRRRHRTRRAGSSSTSSATAASRARSSSRRSSTATARSCSRSTRRWLGRRERDLRTGFRVPEEIVVPSMAAIGRVGGGDAARAARRDRSVAHLGRPRRAARARPAARSSLKGIQTGEDAAARRRARRRRDRRLEPRRPPARRRRADRRRCCPRSSRRSPAGSRSTSTAASAAAPTWSRRWRSAPGPFSPAARRSGVSRPTGRRARGACSSCSATRSSSRSRSAAAPRPRRSPRRTVT